MPSDYLSEDLARFALVGAKSYGRRPTFLPRTGLSQLERVIDRIASGA
jgi:hypothetical protein